MRQGNAGFTLIELLVAIAIIAMLAAILFPVYSCAKQRVTTTRCINNLKQLANAVLVYANDNDGRAPIVGWGATHNWCGSTGSCQWVYPERGSLWKYTRSRDLYFCKADKGRRSMYIPDSVAPPGLTAKDYPLSYSMNSSANCVVVDSLPTMAASKMLLMIHENRLAINDGIYIADPGQRRDVPDDVHYSGTTVSYIDGHARWASKEQLLAERDAGYWKPLR